MKNDEADRLEFERLLSDARLSGRIGLGIVRFVRNFAARRLDIKNFADREEIVSAVLLRLGQKFHCIDSARNPLAYLNSMLWWEKQSYFRRLKKRKELVLYESELGFRYGREQTLEECQA